MAENDITLGEVYRRLEDMEERQGKKLDDIEHQTRLTNGTVIRHGERLTVLERDAKAHGEVAKESKAAINGDAFFSVRMSKRMTAAITSGGGALLMFWPQIKAAILALLGAN